MGVIIILFFLIISSSTLRVKLDSSSNSILQKTIEDINVHQVTLFTTESVANFTLNNPIVVEYPSLRLRLNDSDNKELGSSLVVLKNTLQTSLIIINSDDFSYVKQVINFITQVIPINERPKCLWILPHKQSIFKESAMNNIFLYAWKKNILDFSILVISQYEELQSLIYYFDPFYNKRGRTINQTLENFTSIFLDKLNSINKYPLKIGKGKSILISKDLKYQAAYWAKRRIALYFALENMNFNLIYINKMYDNYLTLENHLYFTDKNVKKNANLLGGSILPNEFSNISLVVSTELECRKILAAAPIIYVRKIFIPSLLLFYIILVPSIIFGLIYLIQRRKDPRHFFKLLDAIRIFLGQSLEFVPRTMIQKIVYVTIVILFVLSNNGLYSGVITIYYDKEEVPLENLEDLDKYPMPIYTHSRYKGGTEFKNLYLFNTRDPLCQSLDNKLDSTYDCIEDLVLKKHVCIWWEYHIIEFINKNRNPDGSAFIKTISYRCNPDFIQFEPGSPYVKKFSKINRRILESGILRMEYILRGFVRPIEGIIVNENEDKKLKEQHLLFILTIGYTLAFVIFMIEYSMTRVKNFKVSYEWISIFIEFAATQQRKIFKFQEIQEIQSIQEISGKYFEKN